MSARHLRAFCKEYPGVAVSALVAHTRNDMPAYGLHTLDHSSPLPADGSAVLVDFGPARLALAPAEALRHPECSVALSKQGCDLVVTTPEYLEPQHASATGHQIIGAHGGGHGCVQRRGHRPAPAAHARWAEMTCDGPGMCQAQLNTTSLRTKRFLESCGFERVAATITNLVP